MLVSGSFPCGSATGEFFDGDVHVDRSLGSVDRDLVAGLNERDRATFLSFRRDVTDDETVRTAAEATVGHQRHIATESRAHDG